MSYLPTQPMQGELGPPIIARKPLLNSIKKHMGDFVLFPIKLGFGTNKTHGFICFPSQTILPQHKYHSVKSNW